MPEDPSETTTSTPLDAGTKSASQATPNTESAALSRPAAGAKATTAARTPRKTKSANGKGPAKSASGKAAGTSARTAAKRAKPAKSQAGDTCAKAGKTEIKNKTDTNRSGGENKKADTDRHDDPSHHLSDELLEVVQNSQKVFQQVINQQAEHIHSPTGMADPMNVATSFADLMVHWMSHPQHVMRAQYNLWQQYMQLWQSMVMRSFGQEVEPVAMPERGDKRFRHEDWEKVDIFDFIKQTYLITARWLVETVESVEGMDEHTKKKVVFHTQQLIDAFSPTNFPLTNPEVLRTSMETGGENLVKGLNNLLKDLERGKGQLQISQTDMEYFEVGRNVATAPGKVVYQNDIFQLLQFTPTTAKVYEKPLLIFPPWINKYYILDLRPENSFIRWMVDQGYTVFVTSWVNPDERLARKSFEDYMREGIFEALDAVEQATGSREVNAIGYCIGGTLLGSSLAYMAANGDDRISSATFFAAQLDFTEAGDLHVFIDDEQLKSLERRMEQAGGYLEGADMAQTFNMLRANDLIWSYVVNNYMLGKEPFRFDLLFWNADATRMPKNLHIFYLREFYQHNNLAEGRLKFGDTVLDLSKVKIPIFMQSSQTDHIAPCKSVFKSHRLFGGDDVNFMVAGSGHIAGVINHPDANKYMYWMNKKDKQPATLEDWWKNAQETPGSWWPEWERWLRPKSGPQVSARLPGDRKLKIIEDAPGAYVKVKS